MAIQPPNLLAPNPTFAPQAWWSRVQRQRRNYFRVHQVGEVSLVSVHTPAEPVEEQLGGSELMRTREFATRLPGS
jgi:hypothetical protein